MESICIGKKFVNGEDFSAEDLDIFADSVEIIARIERERHARRKARRVHRRTSLRCTIEAEVHSQPGSANNTIDYRAMAEAEVRQHSRPVCAQQLRCKLFKSVSDISPIQSSDENYFSAASSVDSPTGGSKESLESVDGITSLPSTDSGTESESGFGGIRPRSNALNRSKRARIIGLIMKKQQQHSTSEEDVVIKEKRERVLSGLLREKARYEKMLKLVQRQTTTESSSGGGLKSISKAFNWLTL